MIETDCRKNRLLWTFSSNALVCPAMCFFSFIHHIEITPNYMILHSHSVLNSIRKQLTFRDATISLPTKWRLINEHRKCILMTRHHAELDRDGSRIFFRRGCTRLLLYFNTNKAHSFFFCRIPVLLENRRSCRRGGGGVRNPLHPPPRSNPVYSKMIFLAPKRLLLRN